jgi:hypothetical protein
MDSQGLFAVYYSKIQILGLARGRVVRETNNMHASNNEKRISTQSAPSAYALMQYKWRHIWRHMVSYDETNWYPINDSSLSLEVCLPSYQLAYLTLNTIRESWPIAGSQRSSTPGMITVLVPNEATNYFVRKLVVLDGRWKPIVCVWTQCQRSAITDMCTWPFYFP